MPLTKYLAGTTRQFTWISSGSTPSPISAAIIDGGESVVSSSSMTSSGNGHYYISLTLPSTEGYYVREYRATVNGLVYKDKKRFKVVQGTVD